MHDRRSFLQTIGNGFGGLAAAHLLADELRSENRTSLPSSAKLQDSGQAASPEKDLNGGLHHRAKVKRVIQLFMTGGASPMDTFDYKPALEKLHGQKLGPKEKPEGFTAAAGAIMKSPFPFKQHGESGRWVSSVFPHQAKLVDEMTFLMAMASKTNVHGPAAYMMNTGFILPGFPCMGSWISYGLGSLKDNLPTFVVLPDAKGLPYNQRGPFSSGFLPAVHQGTMIQAGAKGAIPFLQANRKYRFVTPLSDRSGFQLLEQLNSNYAEEHPFDSMIDARIKSFELAAQMQLSAPEAFDLASESAATHSAYGLDQKTTNDFGRRCLMARRLIERGTRFVQVWSGPQGATENWDNHGSIPKELPPIAQSVDQPIAALLTDLKQRGILDDTLLIWTTEFGRTPFAQGGDGRDHNGGSFVSWMAGAGLKPGISYGKSDEWGYKTAEGKTYCYDFHATILHLMGIDHTRLTYRHNGIDRRLTDVHGHVIKEICA